MPLKRKDQNNRKGIKGENLTQKMFRLKPTANSGAGAYDKGDSKDDWIIAETKVTKYPFYTVNKRDFTNWRLAASKANKQFFLHLIHEEEDKSLKGENSVVVVTESFLKALPAFPPETVLSYGGTRDFPKVSHRLFFDLFEPLKLYDKEVVLLEYIQFDGLILVALPARHFKYLLRKV